MLNRIWTFFFIGGFVAAVGRTLAGHSEVWREMVGATFEMAKTGFEIALGLTGRHVPVAGHHADRRARRRGRVPGPRLRPPRPSPLPGHPCRATPRTAASS